MLKFPTVLLQFCSQRRLWFSFLGVALTLIVYALLSPEQAEWVVRHCGYWFTWLSAVGGLFYLSRFAIVGWSVVRRSNRRILQICMLSWGLISALLFVHAEFGPKVLMDDEVLVSTSRGFSESRQMCASTYGRMIEDQFTLFDSYVDKRPWLYPFVVSIAHDFTGYRVANAYWVNVVVAVVFMGLLHLLGYQIANLRGALLLPLLFLTIPLLAQNATGSGMDMLNLLFILVVMLCAIVYLKKPSRDSEGALCLLAVLLCYGRYESILFLAPVLAIIVCGWVISREVFLSFGAILSAPLLIGRLLQQKFFSANEGLWELHSGTTEPFGLVNVPENLVRAWDFFYSTGDGFANSLWVGVFGLPAVFLMLYYFATKLRLIYKTRPVHLVITIFSLSLLLHFAVIMCYHDGALDRLFASRFALPTYLLLTCAIVLTFHLITQRRQVWQWFYSLSVIFLIGVTLPLNAKAVFSRRNYVASDLAWVERVLQERGASRLLLVDAFTPYWTSRDVSAMTQQKALLSSARLAQDVAKGKFEEILVVDRRECHIVDGEVVLDASKFQSDVFELELLAEKSFKPFLLTQVYRISNLEIDFSGVSGESNQ